MQPASVRKRGGCATLKDDCGLSEFVRVGQALQAVPVRQRKQISQQAGWQLSTNRIPGIFQLVALSFPNPKHRGSSETNQPAGSWQLSTEDFGG